MNTLQQTTFFLFSLTAFGAVPPADPPKPPVVIGMPIPTIVQEEISRAMISLQQRQMALQQITAEAMKQIGPVQAAAQAEEASYLALIEAARKTYKAETCPGKPLGPDGKEAKPELTIRKEWSCPPAQAVSVPPSDEPKAKK